MIYGSSFSVFEDIILAVRKNNEIDGAYDNPELRNTRLGCDTHRKSIKMRGSREPVMSCLVLPVLFSVVYACLMSHVSPRATLAVRPVQYYTKMWFRYVLRSDRTCSCGTSITAT